MSNLFDNNKDKDLNLDYDYCNHPHVIDFNDTSNLIFLTRDELDRVAGGEDLLDVVRDRNEQGEIFVNKDISANIISGVTSQPSSTERLLNKLECNFSPQIIKKECIQGG